MGVKKVTEILKKKAAATKDKAKEAAQNVAAGGKGEAVKQSGLTKEQIETIKELRQEYLGELQKQAPQKTTDEEIEIRWNLAHIESEIFQSYLPCIKERYTHIPAAEWDQFQSRVAWFDITKWVVDPTEDSIEKLSNVYQVFSGEECSIALIYHRSKERCSVRLAICTNKENADPSVVGHLSDRMQSALRGNFPGAICGACEKKMIPGIADEGASVAIVSNLASEKSEHFISQSIEKILDGVVPKAAKGEDDYTILLLADPVLDNEDYIQRLYDQYTAISPYAQVQKQSSISDSASVMSAANIGGSVGVHTKLNAGIQIGYNAGSTQQVGKNEGQTLTYSNFEISHCMERIKQQMERMEQCRALGMWNFAAYVISKDYNTVQSVARMYVSLTQGKESYLEPSAINVWKGGDSKKPDNDVAKSICASLQCLQHPIFGLNMDKNDDALFYPEYVDATVMVSGSELAHAMNFPRKSVSGLPVYECVPFGREVVLHTEGKPADTTEKSKPHSQPETGTDGKKPTEEKPAASTGDKSQPETVQLGAIYHMRAVEETPVALSKDSLTAHTFITGSTGAGKSNAVYTLLSRLCPEPEKEASDDQKKNATHFLVIEPAKGEYKNVFGGREDVHVYGTNSLKMPLLRLNPFSFPQEDTHVLEHIDRLVEVFNACWPMYAAMPAVLKAAIETAYVSCGWNLSRSTCFWPSNGQNMFPTFRDVMKALPQVVDSKGFSNDTQGDYKGALLTRLESLTNGIHGQVLCADDEISSEKLFNENVIIDLSRVGAPETKALLMGILVLKLQEYRMANKDGSNKNLNHITVLEEAHNLLRRTSTEQSQESSNLQGKSVEMLTNAIAEMRTYGEGFIIVDQAPGLLDMAVIRNTNTKIILRLPDESDRRLVGKAAGLNDDQIVELSRLDTGVAAVYQNHWLEPVLCKVDEFKTESGNQFQAQTLPNLEMFLNKLLGKSDGGELVKEAPKIERWIEELDVDRNTKKRLLKALHEDTPLTKKEIGNALYCLVKGNDFVRYVRQAADQDIAEQVIDQRIMESFDIPQQLAEEVRREIFFYATTRVEQEKFPELYHDLAHYGGVK